MAVTLVVNPGSSSKKYAIYQAGRALLTMKFERTALGIEQCTEVGGERQRCEGVSGAVFGKALEHVLAVAMQERVVTHVSDITVAVVRVVVPGTNFAVHRVIDDYYLHHLIEQEWTAPLHVPALRAEVAVLQTLLPKARIVAASDSAFHATMPAVARTYSIKASDAADLDLYRFGYHGLSVASVVRRHHSILGLDPTRVVVCHIGSGVSVTAVRNGQSIETSMGYAPGTGLPMATRAGDLDAGALLALMRSRQLRPLDALSYLSTNGGLYGLSGESDLRLIIEAAARGERIATDTLGHYVYHLARSVAGAIISLGGIDSLVFTGTAGERSSVLRSRIVAALLPCGLLLDSEKNEHTHSADGVISEATSVAKIAVIRTDEMGEMYYVGKQCVEALGASLATSPQAP